jgi:hypothetical protein
LWVIFAVLGLLNKEQKRHRILKQKEVS